MVNLKAVRAIDIHDHAGALAFRLRENRDQGERATVDREGKRGPAAQAGGRPEALMTGSFTMAARLLPQAMSV
jgi:hypothetical protein